MKRKHLANLMKCADSGFIVITLNKLSDANRVCQIHGSSNFDSEEITSILEEIVQKRKEAARIQATLKPFNLDK